MKIFLRAFPGITISLFCLYLFLFGLKTPWFSLPGINFNAVLNSMHEVQHLYLIPYLGIYLLIYYLRALRWHYILKAVQPLPFSSTYSYTMIGFMLNNILPLRAGEVLKPYLLARKENLSFSATLATVFIERILDGLMLLILGATLLFYYQLTLSLPSEYLVALKKTGGILFFVFCSTLLLLWLLLKNDSTFLKGLSKLLFFLPLTWTQKGVGKIHSFALGLSYIGTWKRFFLGFLQSSIIWILIAISFYVIVLSFDLSLSLADTSLLLVFVALGIALPSSPGYIGVFQIICEIALKIFAIDTVKAQSFSIYLWAVNIFPVIFLGLFYFYKENLSWAKIKTLSSSPRQS